MGTKKTLNSDNKTSKIILNLVNDIVICLEMHFEDKDGIKNAEEGLSDMLEAIRKAFESKDIDADKLEDLKRSEKAIITAQKRIEAGTFGKELVVENLSRLSNAENIFKEILERCA